MKMAKIFAIMFALVLAVFCLNGPFVFGGDAHPWDEEGGGGGDGDLLPNSDPVPDPNVPKIIGTASTTVTDVSNILTILKFTLIASTVL